MAELGTNYIINIHVCVCVCVCVCVNYLELNIVSICVAGMSFKLKLHHSAFFQRDLVMQYVGTSNSASVIDIDADKWSFFKAIGILKENFGYGDQPIRLWWKGGDGYGKEMTMDSYALELSDYVIANEL